MLFTTSFPLHTLSKREGAFKLATVERSFEYSTSKMFTCQKLASLVMLQNISACKLTTRAISLNICPFTKDKRNYPMAQGKE